MHCAALRRHERLEDAAEPEPLSHRGTLKRSLIVILGMAALWRKWSLRLQGHRPSLLVWGRPSEPLLSKGIIVDAAMAIVDESGMQAMTTRAIAKRLGVGQASLYNHISSRDELLDLLNARVLEGVDLSGLDHPDWTKAVYRGTLAFLAALQRHPNMMGVLATRPARTDPSLTYYERMHERLRAAGLSAQDSARFPIRHRRLLHRRSPQHRSSCPRSTTARTSFR